MSRHLSVTGLWVGYNSRDHDATVIRDATFSINQGESVALSGPSGCGKTTLAKAVAGLLPPGAWVNGGVDLNGLKATYCVQDNANALNPALKAGYQLSEVIYLQQKTLDPRSTRALTVEALAEVGLARPLDVMDAYPHQLSGGMRQRVLLAMAIACSPDLLIADEVTAGLDADGVQLVTRILRRNILDRGASLLLITHETEVARKICKRWLTLTDGTLMEDAPLYG